MLFLWWYIYGHTPPELKNGFVFFFLFPCWKGAPSPFWTGHCWEDVGALFPLDWWRLSFISYGFYPLCIFTLITLILLNSLSISMALLFRHYAHWLKTYNFIEFSWNISYNQISKEHFHLISWKMAWGGVEACKRDLKDQLCANCVKEPAEAQFFETFNWRLELVMNILYMNSYSMQWPLWVARWVQDLLCIWTKYQLCDLLSLAVIHECPL